MLQHNAGLTASHPYASNPINWPFLLSGISFWTDNDKKQQIYLIGNLVGWWTCVMGVSIFVGVVIADLLARRRGVFPVTDGERFLQSLAPVKLTSLLAVRNRLWNNTGFFVMAWAIHYFPFYLMNRQLFIHHYLPAHLCSCLAAGGVLDFVFSETNNFPISLPGMRTRPRRPTRSDLQTGAAAVALAALTIAMFAMFVFIGPLTYGTPAYVFFFVSLLIYTIGRRASRWRRAAASEMMASDTRRSLKSDRRHLSLRDHPRCRRTFPLFLFVISGLSLAWV
jgi:dolichyl-phosphate-mannose-protein mannosyltransferase